MNSKNSKYTVASIVAIVAVMAIGIPSAISAQTSSEMSSDEPVIVGSTIAPQSFVAKIDTAKISMGEVIERVQQDEKDLVGLTLTEQQGYLVYSVSAISEDMFVEVIVDAGNGDILHESKGIPVESLEKLIQTITSCSESLEFSQSEGSFEDCVNIIHMDPELSSILEN